MEIGENDLSRIPLYGVWNPSVAVLLLQLCAARCMETFFELIVLLCCKKIQT